jgi:tRNA threonylcarbamoyladenosine biosynthesis protein TsaB
MLLAIDTSTAQVGLALYDGTAVLGEMAWQSQAHHTEQLAPSLAELLKRTGTEMDSIKLLGVATGPGSFTSLRVGLAFVKGLALARHLPVVGIPTLDVVAAGMPPGDRNLAAVLQAGRHRLAVGWYQAEAGRWRSLGPAVSMTATELEDSIHKPVVICGELSAEDRHCLGRRYKNVQLASPAKCVRRPGLLAELAWEKWHAGQVDPAQAIVPIYLHVAGGLPA